jgi:PAS domain S-box-containing protein
MDMMKASSYMEHGFCLNWERPLVFLHVGSDIITGISYYSIPIAMFYFAYRRRDLPFFKLFIMFALFIFSCGTTHFFSAYIIYRPEYWIEGYLKAINAAISALTVILFIPRIPEAIALPSIINSMKEVKKLNRELGIKNDALQMANFSIENVNDAIYWILEDGRIFRVNEAACKTLGYTSEELQGFRVSDLDPNFSQDRWQESWRELKAQKSLKLETKHRTKTGSILEVEVVANFMEYGGKEFNCAIVRDITEHRKIEHQLQQVQKMESVGRLAGGVAHDFNNMLGVILGHAEMAMDQVDPTHPLFSDLEEIRSAAERSAGITRQLLAFARKQTVAPQVIDLNETIEGMLKMLRRLIGEDINLAWLPGAGLWPVKIDPSQIDQILANLCVNARDAITDVGKITVETGNGTFDDEYCTTHVGSVAGEYVWVSVSDNGCGMDKPTLAHIFEPFFTTKGVGAGTGLGLSTVYGAAKQNNGFVNVYSEPGQGTIFTIYLPRYVDAGSTGQTRQEGSAKLVMGGHETILLVEDEPTILKMTSRMLQGLGYIVMAAGTPGEAVRLVGDFTGEIHLLMTDVIMPEMNGRDLAKQLLISQKGMRCLFMSGYTSDIIANRGVLDEGVNFIQKPFSQKDLAVKIHEVLATEK